MKCPSCSQAVSGAYEPGSYSCSGCGGQVQVNPARPKHVQFGKEGANKRWGKAKAGGSKKKAKKNPVERLPDWSATEFLRKYGRGSGNGSAKEWAEELKFEHPTNRQMVVGLVADLLYQMDTSQVDARNQGSAAFLERYQAWMEGPSAGVSTSPNVRFPFI